MVGSLEKQQRKTPSGGSAAPLSPSSSTFPTPTLGNGSGPGLASPVIHRIATTHKKTDKISGSINHREVVANGVEPTANHDDIPSDARLQLDSNGNPQPTATVKVQTAGRQTQDVISLDWTYTYMYIELFILCL